MPIPVEFLKEERIAIIRLQGMVESEELDRVIVDEVIPFIHEYVPLPVHLVFDVREYKLDFKQFIDYLGKVGQRRSDYMIPANLEQHFIGSNIWVSSFRTWMKKNFNEQMTVFTSMESALEHIRNQPDLE